MLGNLLLPLCKVDRQLQDWRALRVNQVGKDLVVWVAHKLKEADLRLSDVGVDFAVAQWRARDSELLLAISQSPELVRHALRPEQGDVLRRQGLQTPT